jgi:hypothetical protein
MLLSDSAYVGRTTPRFGGTLAHFGATHRVTAQFHFFDPVNFYKGQQERLSLDFHDQDFFRSAAVESLPSQVYRYGYKDKPENSINRSTKFADNTTCSSACGSVGGCRASRPTEV